LNLVELKEITDLEIAAASVLTGSYPLVQPFYPVCLLKSH